MVLYDGLKYILVYIGGWVGWLERLEEELKVDATTATFDGVLKFFDFGIEWRGKGYALWIL